MKKALAKASAFFYEVDANAANEGMKALRSWRNDKE